MQNCALHRRILAADADDPPPPLLFDEPPALCALLCVAVKYTMRPTIIMSRTMITQQIRQIFF